VRPPASPHAIRSIGHTRLRQARKSAQSRRANVPPAAPSDLALFAYRATADGKVQRQRVNALVQLFSAMSAAKASAGVIRGKLACTLMAQSHKVPSRTDCRLSKLSRRGSSSVLGSTAFGGWTRRGRRVTLASRVTLSSPSAGAQQSRCKFAEHDDRQRVRCNSLTFDSFRRRWQLLTRDRFRSQFREGSLPTWVECGRSAVPGASGSADDARSLTKMLRRSSTDGNFYIERQLTGRYRRSGARPADGGPNPSRSLFRFDTSAKDVGTLLPTIQRRSCVVTKFV
jgi:hypothetical protein